MYRDTCINNSPRLSESRAGLQCNGQKSNVPLLCCDIVALVLQFSLYITQQIGHITKMHVIQVKFFILIVTIVELLQYAWQYLATTELKYLDKLWCSVVLFN